MRSNVIIGFRNGVLLGTAAWAFVIGLAILARGV